MTRHSYRPTSEKKATVAAYLEVLPDGKKHICADRVMRDAEYTPVAVTIPAELHPYISEEGYFCADKCIPSLRLPVHRESKAAYMTLIEERVVAPKDKMPRSIKDEYRVVCGYSAVAD